MAITSLNTSAVVKYVSKLDPGYSEDGNHAPDVTVWHLGAMDSYIQAHVSSAGTSYTMKNGASEITEDNVEQNVDIKVDIHSSAIEACRLCIKGWTNFPDTSGNETAFKTKKTMIKGRMYQAIDPDIMAVIPQSVVMDLYTKINEISNLTETEIKNSAQG